MNHAFPLRRDALRRGGFTLIEVVIALAIFLFGALAIVRIFPPALGIIQNSGDQLTAINLNRSTLAQLEKSPNLVPDATYDLTPPNTAPTFSGAVVGTASRNDSLPRNNIQGFNDTALAHFRTITGERQVVSAGTPTALYVVTQYPYASRVSVCEEDEVEGVTMRSDGRLDFSDAKLKSTGADFRDATNPLYPPLTGAIKTYGNSNLTDGSLTATGDSVFYVSYSWIEGANIQSVVDEPLIYSTTPPTSPTALPTEMTVQGRRKIAGTATEPAVGPVKVRFRRLKYRTPTPTTVIGDNLRGFVDLVDPTNPTTFVAGETVSLDYTVEDWRWLVSNESPSVKPEEVGPNDNFRAVITPVHFFDKDIPLLTLTIDQSKNAVRGSYAAGTASATGFPPAASTPPPSATYPVDAKKGQVVLDLGNNTTFARSRVVYRTLDNWTHQLSVASRSYKQSYPELNASNRINSVPAEQWRNYVYIDDDGDNSNNDGYLYFSPTEAGKSIAVSYLYIDNSTPTTFDAQVSKRILTVEQNTIDSPNATTGRVAINGKVSRLALTDNSGNILTTRLKGIQAVLGASIQSRTAWIDGDKFTQVSSVGLRAVNN